VGDLAALMLHDQALRLWRGQAYAELSFEDFIKGDITRLEEMGFARSRTGQKLSFS
jgi:hypothetical protein